VVEEVAQRSVVEEVAQRPSRLTRGWDGSSTELRGFEARFARTSATGRVRTSYVALTTVAEVRRPLGLSLEAR